MKKVPRKSITTQNLNLLKFICEHKIIKISQIHKSYFKSKCTQENVANICARFEKLGVVTINLISKPAHLRQRRGREEKAVFLTRKNLTALRKILEKNKDADAWEEFSFDDYTEQAKETDNYASHTLEHETGITRVKIALESPLRKNSDISLRLFLNTSPSHPHVSQSVLTTLTKKDTGKEYKKTLPFNPDGFFALINDGMINFFFLEYDRHTETQIEKLTKKWEAYYAYFSQEIFAKETLPRINDIYGLNLPPIKKSAFRVLFTKATKAFRGAEVFCQTQAVFNRH